MRTALTQQPIRGSEHDHATSYAYLGIVLAVIAWSFAAILARLALDDGIPAVVIAAGRLSISALVLTPIVVCRYRSELARLTRSDMLLVIFAGFLLGVHFICVNAALEHTSVMVASVLISSTPLWTSLLEWFAFDMKLPHVVKIGIAFALIGTILVGIGGDSKAGFGDRPLLGAGLAVFAAAAVSVYMIIGRKVRSRIAVLPYIWMVYGLGGLFASLAIVPFHAQVTGHSAQGYFWLLLVAIVPQLIGHSLMNFALAYLSATYISIASQVSLVLATILAFFIFEEQPLALQLVGSVAILGGVLMTNLGHSVGQAQPPDLTTAPVELNEPIPGFVNPDNYRTRLDV